MITVFTKHKELKEKENKTILVLLQWNFKYDWKTIHALVMILNAFFFPKMVSYI